MNRARAVCAREALADRIANGSAGVIHLPTGPADDATMRLVRSWPGSLHAFGLDQHALWYEHSGRKEIPTNLGGEIVRKVFS